MKDSATIGRRSLSAVAGMAVAAMVAGCGGSGSGSPGVPALSGSASAGGGAGAAGQGRAAALHTAAQCIRQHGIPGYQDPVLTPGGQVYSDLRAFQSASQDAVTAVHQACRTVMAQASLNPFSEPPAPPALVQAGVRLAECERAHGLPQVTDPNANSRYVPGHGFEMTGSGPAGGKANPGFQQALRACNRQIDAAIRASTLGNLASDG